MASQQRKGFKKVTPPTTDGKHLQLTEQRLSEEIKNNPNNVNALSMLASMYMQKNEIFSAIHLLQRAIQIAPSSPLLNDLGVAYRKIGQPKLAFSVLQKAIALNGNNGVALFNYGAVLNDLGESEKGLEFIRLAGEKIESLRIPSIAASASIKEGLGLVDEAFTDIMTLIEQGHKVSSVLRALGNILRQHTKFSEHIDFCIHLLVEALEQKTIKPHEINSYYHLLGHLYQKKKDYDSAFIAFEKGHQHSSRGYNENFELAVIDRISQFWSTIADARLAVNSPAKQKLFFIVGMPRSGSTLVEQIMSVYPESVALGESSFFSAALTECSNKSLSLGDPATSGGRPLTSDEAKNIRSLYMQRAFHTRRPTAIVTDKTLTNTIHVGQILQVFPNAKIIWTSRDPRDVCLSCYTFDFAGAHAYRHDLRALARYHNRTEKLMQFWQGRYPESVYTVCYEELIRNPENSIRELIAFCDLPWSDDYLRFHQVKRKVSTASYNQVTQPIYTSAIGRWKVYEKHLAPLLEELDLPSEE